MRPWVRKTLEHAICLLVVAIAAMAALHPAVFNGRVAVPASDILFAAPWEEGRPEGLEPSGLPSHAPARQHYPWYVFMSDSVARGDSLLWNPLEGCGMPFFALWRSRCLSPFSLPFYFFDAETGLKVSAFLKLLAAGICGFLAGRRLGFAPALALFIGLSFQLSASLLHWLSSPLSDTLPWLPLLLIFVDRLALGRIHYWPYGALVLALMLLGGEPEAVAGILAVTVFFIVARNLLGRRGYVQLFASLSTYAIAASIAAALCAIQILPFYELVQESAALGNLEPVVNLRLPHLAAVFLPHLFGDSPFAFADDALSAQARLVLVVYAGIVQLWLIPLWFALRRYSTPPQRHRIEALLITSAAALVLAMVFPFRHVRPEHLLAANSLLVAIAAAAAAEEWVSLDAEGCKRTLKRLIFTVPVTLVAALVICALGWQSAVSPRLNLLAQGLLPAVFLCVLVLLVLTTLLKPSLRVMGYALSAVAVVQALAMVHPGSAPPAFMAPEALFPRTEFIETLQEGGRRAGGSLQLKNWPLAGNLIPQTYAPSGVLLKRHRDFFAVAEDQPLLTRRTGAHNLILTKEDIQGPFAAMRPLLRLKHVLPAGAGIFEDLEAKPRAWITFEGRPVETFDPDQLDAQRPPLMENAVPPPVENAPEGTAEILPESGNTRVQIAVESKSAGVLYLADAWYPGWRASVNGNPATVFPIDGLFRGVRIPEGTSVVEMVYEPRSLIAGAWVSLAAALATGGFILYLAIRWLMKHHRARKLERELGSHL